jgi:bifunctional DNA-binding transcriptional regulator/antitoxin component of YhaV-PrlF toxin-antitoxin module
MGRYEARTSVKGQTTIPVEVRRLIGLDPGGSVQFVTTPEGDVKVIAKKKSLRHLKALFGPSDTPFDVDAAIEETVRRRTDPQRTEVDP